MALRKVLSYSEYVLCVAPTYINIGQLVRVAEALTFYVSDFQFSQFVNIK